jgi:hypothetical protein
MTMSVESPKKSPSLNEEGKAFLVDESGNRLAIVAVVCPNSSGQSGLSAQVLEAGGFSQVTAREDALKVITPSSHGKAPILALASMDASGNLIPFAAPSATLAAQATKLNGVFASAEQTGNGSEQSVAHGLAVIPSKVLIAVTDNTAIVDGRFAVVEGTHTTSAVKVTVTSGVKYKVLAFI